MNNYDFETVIKRYESGSHKWDEMAEYNNINESVIPFSLADMELVTPPEIKAGLKAFIDNNVLGYALPTDEYKTAVQHWMSRRHGWSIQTDWIKDSPGVINAFSTAIKAFTNEGEGVMLMTPVYYPMYFAIDRNHRKLVDNQLVINGDRYEIDFHDFEEKAKDPNTKLLILCSPHNPTGRVWSENELKEIGEICINNDVIVVVDEIHHDIISPGYKHIVFASLDDRFADRSITCTAPSKTFNLAGLQTSNIIIPNKEIRERYHKEACKSDGNPKCNILGLQACKIAYNDCEEWLNELNSLINRNRLSITNYITEHFPQIKLFNLEGTYLLWMDFNQLDIDPVKLHPFLRESAQLFLDDGAIFGEQGNGFGRWNLACPTRYIDEALERLGQALKSRG